MQTTTRVVIDLLSGGYSEPVHAVQGDAYSRAVELDIRQQKARWPIPNGLAVALEYRKPDGTKGAYDTLPDGTRAWSAEGNILTLQLAPQMLTVPGTVAVQVRMMKGDAVLSLFKFHVFVHQELTGGTSEDYINLNAFLPQVKGAKVGQYFQIEEVDTRGTVTKIRAVDAPQGGGGDIPEALPNPKSLTFKGAVEATYDGSEAVIVEIPDSSQNANQPLTFTGAVNATYDGSEAVEVEIPQGGGVTDEQIASAVEAYMAEHPAICNGLTTAQIAAIDELFKIAAYTEDASSKYAAFRAAFGLDNSEGDGGDEESGAKMLQYTIATMDDYGNIRENNERATTDYIPYTNGGAISISGYKYILFTYNADKEFLKKIIKSSSTPWFDSGDTPNATSPFIKLILVEEDFSGDLTIEQGQLDEAIMTVGGVEYTLIGA